MLSKYTGCLLGGAVGDALGAPAEFLFLPDILHRFGPGGVIDFIEFSDGLGRITDDTQMTLFTAEGILKAGNKLLTGFPEDYLPEMYTSYLRWLHTQSGFIPQQLMEKPDLTGGLMELKELFRRRAPGNTCLSALQSGKMGTIDHSINDSKGCGGVMRVAPVGLIEGLSPEMAFRVAAEAAAITHSHPSGYLPAGALAALLAFIRKGFPLEEAITRTMTLLGNWKDHGEVLNALAKAVSMASSMIGTPSFSLTEKLGGGWTGEEALAISVYCALCFPDDFEKAVILSVNHSGDSDSTGAITGNILGFLLGEEAIPSRWLEKLEIREQIRRMAEGLFIL